MGKQWLTLNLNRKTTYNKIWNRLSSGSYFPPPVRRVDIPKSNGKSRPLGIPTISDRIAQMVIKNRLEPVVEPYFHKDSYGYRPGKSALGAIAQARRQCWQNDWVLDMDIMGFFDALDHKFVMIAVSRYTQCKWTLLYIERWLKADVILPSGELVRRTKGTSQGGVISPLLANIFLHLGFDKWMRDHHPHIPFERYADDIVVHCRNRKQLEFIEANIRTRFAKCKLELCPEKTKIVYCKDSNRKSQYINESFDFLGYTFRPRSSRASAGKFFVSFSPAVSRKALKAMRCKIKEHPMLRRCFSQGIEEIAKAINPMIQGWINYYGKYCKSAMSAIYDYINEKIIRWAKHKYKHLKRRPSRAGRWLRELYSKQPMLFAHWRIWSWVAE